MPYIRLGDRPTFDHVVSTLPLSMKVGEINYLITKILLRYLGPEPRYENFNAALGVLEAVKQELYRRLAGPYEEKKREENGDVFGS